MYQSKSSMTGVGGQCVSNGGRWHCSFFAFKNTLSHTEDYLHQTLPASIHCRDALNQFSMSATSIQSQDGPELPKHQLLRARRSEHRVRRLPPGQWRWRRASARWQHGAKLQGRQTAAVSMTPTAVSLTRRLTGMRA